MNNLWQITIEQYLEIIELAKQHGKKEGDSMQEEFNEIMKKYKIKSLGTTNKDIDDLTGDLRENGIKVLNLKEIERRKKNNEKEI